MNIQAIFDQEALDMLKKTSEYISSVAKTDANRAAHHRHVSVQKICNSSTCLDNMTTEQLSQFDNDVCEHLTMLDVAH